MSRIGTTFTQLQANGHTAFMPYLVAGDPDLETTKRLILALERAGASLVELGIPFSDPLADGPTNQQGAQRALQAGTTVPQILEMVGDLRQTSQIPIMLMGYYNPFHHYGLAAFCSEAAAAGADGLIIPDLQPDDVAEIRPHAEAYGLDTVFLIAPTSTPERLALVGRETRGFAYAVSLTGVTGARDRLPPDLEAFVARARQYIDKPICVGFGISTPAMAAQVGRLADGVIVGSAIVKRIGHAAATGADPVPDIEAFAASIVAALE